MFHESVLRDHLLVETEWLVRRLGDPRIRVVDIRGFSRPPDQPKPWYIAKRDAYLASHIPGAVFVDWTQDIVEPDAPVPMTLAGPERFKALMERLGIGDATEVVVYDDAANVAPRLWWALNYYGHSQVRLLDGGFTKWLAEGRPVDASESKPPRATFTPRVQPGWRAGAAEVRAALAGAGAVLLDCRSVKEFRGELGRGERPGRIPDALNLHAAKLTDGEHKTWRDAAEIRRMCEVAGVTPARPIITYCNAGVQSSVGLFGLRLAGHPDAVNFAGSWYEWERDPANPVVTGE
jgi:thiosulfate/3-mercaptopyruvate sulfurtransferase